MPTITTRSIVSRKSGILNADVGDEVVLMSVDAGQYYGLDDIASKVWHRLAESTCVADLVRDLSTAYEGDPTVIETDVLRLLETLGEMELITAAT